MCPAPPPSDALPSMLEAATIECRFGKVRAVRGASLRVGVGECVALVGESGSGKSTLLRCFNALIRPSAGRVRVRGRAVEDTDPVDLRRSIGYVPQHGGLLPHWTVARNAALVPALRGDGGADLAGRRALERVGLPVEEFGPRWPRTLSGGQRQRVALARALAAEPDVILMDEPLGALDALARAELRTELATLIRETGATVLLVTHDLAEAAALADRIAVMREGVVVQAAPLATLRAAPADAYVTELLDRGLGVGRGP